MTDLLRSNTLRLRRPVERSAAAAISRPRTGAVTTARPTQSSVSESGERSERSERSLRSDTLLQGHSHISIMHNGETYQLRATRLGKLILTK
ncbi:hemin uptake protein HemP [Caballeronia sp. LjRoot31]|uniref:hemin uptake protein HemP n=1 Tax=Caballeronia sp. LjRoot31 TaxID=3342324 RepID=UPI003ECF3FEB